MDFDFWAWKGYNFTFHKISCSPLTYKVTIKDDILGKVFNKTFKNKSKDKIFQELKETL